MPIKELEGKSAVTLSKYIRNGELKVREVFEFADFKRQKLNGLLNAYISFDEQECFKETERLQKEVLQNEIKDLLFGIPLAVKDNMCTKDINTTCGSAMLENFVPGYSAHAVDKCLKSGMYVAGKCNMDEFSMGSTSETSYFGPVRNPWDTNTVPGGSSGGCACAVASGMAYVALGSDTGGSVRQPASLCGVTGLKPTYGTVSRYGLVAYGSSFDQIGPIAVHALDTAALLDLIQGPDRRDSTCTIKERQMHYKTLEKALAGAESFGKPLKGKKIAVLSEYAKDGTSECVKDKLKEFIGFLEDQGAKCEEKSIESLVYSIPAYYITACAQAGSNLSRFDGVKYTSSYKNAEELNELYLKTRSEYFGKEVKRRILLGAFVLSSGYFDEYYMTAQKAVAKIKSDFDELLGDYDAALTPTCTDTAKPLGTSLNRPLEMYAGDAFTVIANITGLPAISIPFGTDKKGLPVGMQLISKAFDEDTLLYINGICQQRTDHHLKRPEVKGGKEGKDE